MHEYEWRHKSRQLNTVRNIDTDTEMDIDMDMAVGTDMNTDMKKWQEL